MDVTDHMLAKVLFCFTESIPFVGDRFEPCWSLQSVSASYLSRLQPGPFAKFEETYIDGKGNRQPFVDEKGVIRWDLCHGHLTRHFHWVSLAKAYAETKNERYAKQ